MATRTVTAVVHQAEEGGFWAEVPELPGCVSQGETLEELRANLEDAVQAWLEAIQHLGADADYTEPVVALMPIEIVTS
jgi:predicted RNase H-like HicB family nuclease